MNFAEARQGLLKPARRTGIILVILRWALGGLFIYMGATKAADPVEFLKLVRQYELLPSPALLNFVSATVPWFEIFCGLLLLAGIAVRGTALLLTGLLAVFTMAILFRAFAIGDQIGISFCAIKFDCGCGAGDVLICRKLGENLLLLLAAGALVFSRPRQLSEYLQQRTL